MHVKNFLELPLVPEQIHGGEGLCPHTTVFSGAEIDAPAMQFLNYTVLPPQASYGLHKHGDDNEFYVVLSGEGVYMQDGEEVAVKTGSIMMNAPHGTHAIRNTGSEDLRLLVFEVKCG